MTQCDVKLVNFEVWLILGRADHKANLHPWYSDWLVMNSDVSLNAAYG